MSLLTGMVPSANLERAKKAMASSGVRTTRMPQTVEPVRAEDVLRSVRGVPAVKLAAAYAVLSANPTLVLREVARRAGCSPLTANRAYHKLLDEGKLPMRRRGSCRVVNYEPLLAALRADPERTTTSLAAEFEIHRSTVSEQIRDLAAMKRVRIVRVMRVEVIDA